MEILVGDTIYFDATDGINGVELWAFETVSTQNNIIYG